jgi:hypothetical protein
MWERPSDEETIDIPMFVVSVETPLHPDRDDHEIDDDRPPTDPTLLPRQGTGTWPNGERAVRLGNAEEILITLASNPFSAMDAARSGAVFAASRRLRVDIESRRDGDFEVSWTATLRTGPYRWRAATFRVYASPSLNVTVMTIVPNKARRISSRGFVRHGLRAARDVGRAIEQSIQSGSSDRAAARSTS